METKELSYEVTDYSLESDGLMSWEDFYGSSNENLVESILEMYDLLIRRSSEIKDELISSQRVENCFTEKQQPPFEEITRTKSVNKCVNTDVKKNSDNFCDIIKQNWNCRCTEKSVVKAITRCAACDTKEIRSTDIRDNHFLKSEVLSEINSNCQSEPSLPHAQGQKTTKCELVTCPAGFSTPTTPTQQRIKRLGSSSPLTLKRNENGFRCVTRPSSVSSLTSSSSSSSGTSSCFGARRLGVPHKSSAYLASIESLEDDSDIESQVQKNDSCRSSKKSEGSEDSGVHSPCTSLPQDRPKYCDPHLSYMDKVVMEIIETEEVYVKDLQKIIEGYLLKWRSIPDFPLADRLDCLFGNIESIFRFNSLFLTELEQCGLDPVKVARCFVKYNSGFWVYTEYCTNYPRTVSLLTELMRQEGTVRLFRERQTALQHTLPLGSYLLKPVQRILKYHLLLQNIVKQYSNGFDGYKDIVDALRTMTEIAQHINDMKRRHEHEVRVQEIQSLLLGWEGEDLTTFGELCAEGTFRMYGAKAARHVFLFDKMVLITKKKEGGILGYKTHINCSNLMLIESVPGEPLSFHIIPFDNPKLQYTLQCRNLEQKREWTLQLKRVILENYNAVIPSHARQLVMELGQSRIEDENLTNKILPKRQHLAPEYLEKRKQDRRKTESTLKSRLQRNKKLETGDNFENQFNKSRSFSQKISSGTKQISEESENATTVKRRKSESDMGLYCKEEDIEILEKNTQESTTNSESPEKLEIKTLEQIVAQILKQNTEFDKILKRQQKRGNVGKEYGFDSRRKKKKEEMDKNIQETVESFDYSGGTQPESKKQKGCNIKNDHSLILNDSLDSESSLNDFKKVQLNTNENKITADNVIENFSKISLDEESIPTSPSVWLKQQVHHLPTPTKKAGSLPRSFQICSKSSPNDPRCFRDFRVYIERPFTIASDKLPSTMLFEGIEGFCKGKFRRSNSDTTEDESLTECLSTPGASLDHINIHPEYKIYRSNLPANIFKNVLSSVQSKLSQIKTEISPKIENEKNIIRRKKTSRLVYILAKHYQKTIKNMQKDKNFNNSLDLNLSFNSSEPNLLVYEQGSPSIGAKLANFTETDYRINRIRPSKKAAALLGVCADSLLSLSPSITSPEKALQQKSSAINDDEDQEVTLNDTVDSDESTDGFYEKSFEAIDHEFLQNVKIHEEADNFYGNETNNRTPPPVPAKPKRELIMEKLEEISERKRIEIEEGDSSSQHSTASTVIEINRNKDTENAEIWSKGWVKHVIGKIQGGS